MKSARRAAPLLTAVLLCLGCGQSEPEARPTIRVAAAGDLQRALPIVAARFKLDTGIEVLTTIGASGTLAEQIKQGAPYDVFLSADRAFVDDLAKAGLIKEASVKPYARGALSLVTAKNRDDIATPADLDKSTVKTFAIANPTHAPYGLAARRFLEGSGLWDKLEPKRVLASNVREALRYVESGDADAAFVGRALAVNSKLKVIPIPPESHPPIVQYLGVVAKTSSPTDAERFAAFITGEVGQGMLRDLGFSTVPTEPAEPSNADVH